MKRRHFITLLGVAAVAWPLVARAQQASMPVIGYLSGWSSSDAPEYLTYFRRGLAETGYTERRNVAFEFRFAEGHFERIPELVADAGIERLPLPGRGLGFDLRQSGSRAGVFLYLKNIPQFGEAHANVGSTSRSGKTCDLGVGFLPCTSCSPYPKRRCATAPK